MKPSIRQFAKAVKKPVNMGNRQVKKAKGDGGNRLTQNINEFVSAVENAKKIELDFTEEELAEHAKIAKEYTRQMQMIRNRDDKDITTKIYMQQEALNSMPENSEMLMNALEIDDTPPPSDRPWPTFATPPITDFDVKQYTKSEEDGDDEDGEEVLQVAEK